MGAPAPCSTLLGLAALLAAATGTGPEDARLAEAGPTWTYVYVPESPAGALPGALEDLRVNLVRRARAALPDARVEIVVEPPGRVAVSLPAGLGEAARERLGAALVRPGVALELLIVAEEGDLELDLATEHAKLARWAAEHPGVPVARFGAVPLERGGPDPRIAWFPRRAAPRRPDPGQLARVPAEPCLRGEHLAGAPPEDPAAWTFTHEDLARVDYAEDDAGRPLVRFELEPERRAAFADFSAAHEGRRLAIVLGGEIVSAPWVAGPLPGAGVLRGDFEPAEVRELVEDLRSSWPLRGELRRVR